MAPISRYRRSPGASRIAPSALAAISIVVSASGCGGTSERGPATPTRDVTTGGPPGIVDDAPTPAGTQLYNGQAFAIAYPSGWWVHSAEQPTSFGTDTTILDPEDQARAIRVDIRAHAPGSIRAWVLPGIQRARTQPGYAELEVRPVSFRGRRALRWRYDLDRHGRVIRKEALSFVDPAGRGVMITTQAPVDGYAALSKSFSGARDTYLPR